VAGFRRITHSKAFNQSVVVENRPGANGNIGTQAVAKMPADGYTLQVVTTETHAINPHVYKSIAYDVFRDFEPIALFFRSSLVLGAKSALPYNNVQELIAAAKAAPGKLAGGSYGVGSAPHLTLASLEAVTGTSFLHVPYRGSSPTVNALLTGEVDVAFVTPHFLVDLRKNGQVKILGAATKARVPTVPDVPTIIEQGIPDFIWGGWTGVVAPKGIPPEIKQRLVAALEKIVHSDVFTTRAVALGVNVEFLNADQFAEFLRSENERWGKVARERKIEVTQ
jgi:tripartite-type tricarboxylate transporter receptor subunit TctC